MALLASLAPITVFFTLSTESYAFIVLLNVAFFATAGFVGVVGAQMGWVLRPFVGDPALPFTLFREREGNFLLAVLVSIRHLLMGS